MQSATLSHVKKELQSMPHKELLEVCIRLMKYKKENKELVSYILFESGNEKEFIVSLKSEVSELFADVNTRNIFWAKKTLRKILRLITKQCRFSGLAITHIEMLIYFCENMNALNLNFSDSKLLQNMYDAQLKKINKLVHTLHEDLQFDYNDRIAELLKT